MHHKIFITEPICPEAITILEKEAEIIQPDFYNNNVESLIKIVKETQVDGIIVRANTVDKNVFLASQKLRVIVKHGVGYNNIDIESAKKYHIPVLYTPYANFESVAEFTVGLLYLLYKKYFDFTLELKSNHNWDKTKYQTIELNKKVLGIIGFGKIGRRVVELVSPLKMKILVYDPFLSAKQLPEEIKKVIFLDELLNESDFVSIHCPSTKNTRYLLGEKEFKKMKKDAFLINTARGDIINENALLKALKNQWISGAAVDTFEKEPPDLSGEIFSLRNLITTPHIGGSAKESSVRMGMTSAKLILKVLNNEINEINDEYFVFK